MYSGRAAGACGLPYEPTGRRMSKKPAGVRSAAAWDDADGDAVGDDVGYEADVKPRKVVAPAHEMAVGRRVDTVAEVLAALPAGEAGRALKLALLDALEASARADRVALPVELQGLRARVRAGTA